MSRFKKIAASDVEIGMQVRVDAYYKSGAQRSMTGKVANQRKIRVAGHGVANLVDFEGVPPTTPDAAAELEVLDRVEVSEVLPDLPETLGSVVVVGERAAVLMLPQESQIGLRWYWVNGQRRGPSELELLDAKVIHVAPR